MNILKSLTLGSFIFVVSFSSSAQISLDDQVQKILEILPTYSVQGVTKATSLGRGQGLKTKAKECSYSAFSNWNGHLNATIKTFDGYERSEVNGHTYPKDVNSIHFLTTGTDDEKMALAIEPNSVELTRSRSDGQEQVLKLEFSSREFIFENLRKVSISHKMFGVLTNKKIECLLNQ